MIGGAGNDTFVVNSIRDVLADSAGVDLVKSTVSKTLATGFEKLTLLGAAAINGTGNAAANVIDRAMLATTSSLASAAATTSTAARATTS